MTIERWLQPEHILLDIEAADRAEALDAAAAIVGRTHAVDPVPIRHALERREQTGSTAMGGGFAIPHARVRAIEQPLTLFMRLKRAIAFGAPDGRPVSQLLVILVPTEGSRDDHLALLAAVARLFSDADFRSELDKSADVAAAAAAFRVGIARILAR
jgi:PTS system nitrogen regulatory IIA component